MKKLLNKLSIFLFLTVYVGAMASTNVTIDSLMIELNKTIDNREIYLSQKENRLKALRQALVSAHDDESRFIAMGDLLDEFRPYNTDSAFAYCQMRENLAKRTGNQQFIINAQLNTANVLGSIGMYKEALDIIDAIPNSHVPEYLLPYYYYIKRTVASYLCDFSVRQEDKDKYYTISGTYQDSLLSLCPKGTLSYIINKADKYNRIGECHKSVEILEEYLANNEYTTHDRAICANTLAWAYERLGDADKQKENLLISSIADLQSSVREYVSLRQLAVLLFKDGDIDNAHKFLQIAMDDAQKCNARLRILEINDIFPIVNSTFVQTIQSKKKQQKLSIIIISILVLFLIATSWLIWKQMKKTSRAYEETRTANGQLKNLNAELVDFNNRLTDANHAIAENSRIKEEYIAQYMDQCSLYIEKIDAYRKSLNKLLSAGKTDELKKMLRTTDLMDEELESFYRNFDITFLKLFPTFVDDFNKLLSPEGQIILKKEGRLNTELRIFALIKLGISDSVKIARFLRYSVTTIYNYRTKTRNKAAGNRNELEKKVMEIGRQGM